MTRRRADVKHYLGIDPGKTGGMAVLRTDGTVMESTRMPDGPARIIDWIARACEVYSSLVMVVELSQAFPRQGIVSAFRYGRHFGTFEAAAHLLKIRYTEFSPVVWKKAMKVTNRKADSIAACRRLFPTVELTPKGCRTEHDGIAEALLIAEWARRKNL